MPAIRSTKGYGKEQKEEVDPCGIYGIVLNRKSDLPRHAKRYASDEDKPRYTVEGYNYKTWQQSNVYTHIWRQKRLHGNSSTGPKNNKPKKIVPVRVLRGVEAESPDPVNAVASQFSKLSFAEASTSAQCYA